MNSSFGESDYRSVVFEDEEEQATVWELYRRNRQGSPEQKVARMTYWDALGHYYVETMDAVPVKIVLELYEEAQRI